MVSPVRTFIPRSTADLPAIIHTKLAVITSIHVVAMIPIMMNMQSALVFPTQIRMAAVAMSTRCWFSVAAAQRMILMTVSLFRLTIL